MKAEQRRRLREAAWAAQRGQWVADGWRVRSAQGGVAKTKTLADAEYIAAASPDVILDLLQYVDQLEGGRNA